MKRVSLQKAYVLHRRPYRESSFLVELFTQDHGRLSVVARGAYRPRSMMLGLLQPFIPLWVSWCGSGELMTLSQVEADGEVRLLAGDTLLMGFYLNELMMYLLPKWDPHVTLYAAYQKTLSNLYHDGRDAREDSKHNLQVNINLRTFEFTLLDELGYGVLPKTTATLHNRFHPAKHYIFIPDQGLVICESRRMTKQEAFLGEHLIAMAMGDWQNKNVLLDAKRLTRCVLMPLLGTRAIYSRQLLMPINEEVT